VAANVTLPGGDQCSLVHAHLSFLISNLVSSFANFLYKGAFSQTEVPLAAFTIFGASAMMVLNISQKEGCSAAPKDWLWSMIQRVALPR
jgi:hypothetical protein